MFFVETDERGFNGVAAEERQGEQSNDQPERKFPARSAHIKPFREEMQQCYHAAGEHDVVIAGHDDAGDRSRIVGISGEPQSGFHIRRKAGWMRSESKENRSPQPHRGIHNPDES